MTMHELGQQRLGVRAEIEHLLPLEVEPAAVADEPAARCAARSSGWKLLLPFSGYR